MARSIVSGQNNLSFITLSSKNLSLLTILQTIFGWIPKNNIIIAYVHTKMSFLDSIEFFQGNICIPSIFYR